MNTPEYTHNKQIPSYQYQSFLAKVTQEHQGQAVGVEVDGNLLIDLKKQHLQDTAVTLQNITFEHRFAKPEVLIELAGTDQKPIIKGPTLVWAVYNQNRRLVAVEFIDEHGANLILRFD